MIKVVCVWCGLLLWPSQGHPQNRGKKDFAEDLKQRYKGVQVTVMVARMYGGEFIQDAIGRTRYDGVAWHHFHESLPFKGGKTVLDQLDDRTYAIRGTGMLVGKGVGTNTFPLEKGEPVAVSKTFFGCARGACEFTLYLTTLKLSKAASLDPRKASRTGTFEANGLGCQFTIHFDEGLAKAGDVDVLTKAVGKYLLPSVLAEAELKKADSVEIDLGISEEDVVKRLGEPLKSIRVGNEKTLKYADLTVLIRDGKVVDVKVQ